MLVSARLACIGESNKGISECHESLPLSVYEIELSNEMPSKVSVHVLDFMLTPRSFKDNKKPASPREETGFETSWYFLLLCSGAACRNRTGDLFITNELLYQLS